MGVISIHPVQIPRGSFFPGSGLGRRQFHHAFPHFTVKSERIIPIHSLNFKKSVLTQESFKLLLLKYGHHLNQRIAL